MLVSEPLGDLFRGPALIDEQEHDDTPQPLPGLGPRLPGPPSRRIGPVLSLIRPIRLPAAPAGALTPNSGTVPPQAVTDDLIRLAGLDPYPDLLALCQRQSIRSLLTFT